MYDPHSYERNFCNCVEKPEKFRASTEFEPIASLDFISAIQYMFHFIYTWHHFIVDSFHMITLEPTNDQLPTSADSWLSWLERRTGIARSQVQTTLKS